MSNLMKRLKKIWNYGWGRVALAAICAHSVSISIGICQGYSAILIPQLNRSHEFSIDTEQSSWLASLGAITNPVGSVLSGLLAEWFGRTKSMQASSVPFIAGWLCIALASNIWWLYAGRLITGIAAGMATACYTYVSEISTPEHRGVLQALGPVMSSFGILLTYTLGYFINWNLIALFSVIFAVFTVASMHFLPESSGHLFKKHKKKEAFDSLIWFKRSNAAAQAEYQKLCMDKSISKEEEDTENVYFSSRTAKPFVILVSLFIIQEFSGIYPLLFYAVSFFQEADMDVDNFIASIIVGVIRFAMSVVGALLINKYARRKLLMFSSSGMCLSLLSVIIYLKYYEFHPAEEKIFNILPLIGILFNVLFSMIGMLPIPWILVGELFPLKVRSIMCGIVICIAQSFITICVKIYPDMITQLNFSGTLTVFAASSFVGLVFAKFWLPETKNKTLEEIEDYFRSRKRLDGEDNDGFNGEAVVKIEQVCTIHV